MSYDSGDQRFGKRLEAYGATFRGSPYDDSPAIQEALNDIAFDGKFHKVTFPEGGLTAGILTPSGDASLTDGKTYVGLTIPGNLSVDFNGCTLDASSANWGSADTVIALVDGIKAVDSYSNNLRVIERGKIKGNTSFDDLLFLGDKSATGIPHSHFKNMVFTTSNAIVTGADNFHQVTFTGCQFHNWGASGYAITTFGGSSNWGENIRFRDCGFFNAAGGVVRARGAGAGTYVGYMFHGCSFDYVRQFVTCDAAGPTMVQLYGCHLECRDQDVKYASSNHYMLNIADAATTSQILMIGGAIVLTTGSSGNAIAAVCSTGDTGAAAPYGIVLRNVYRQLAAVTLNAGKTGRFSDDA